MVPPPVTSPIITPVITPVVAPLLVTPVITLVITPVVVPIPAPVLALVVIAELRWEELLAQSEIRLKPRQPLEYRCMGAAWLYIPRRSDRTRAACQVTLRPDLVNLEGDIHVPDARLEEVIPLLA